MKCNKNSQKEQQNEKEFTLCRTSNYFTSPAILLRANILIAPMYLQPRYGKGVFGNVYLLAQIILSGKHCRRPIAIMGVADALGVLISIYQFTHPKITKHAMRCFLSKNLIWRRHRQLRRSSRGEKCSRTSVPLAMHI